MAESRSEPFELPKTWREAGPDRLGCQKHGGKHVRTVWAAKNMAESRFESFPVFAIGTPQISGTTLDEVA